MEKETPAVSGPTIFIYPKNAYKKKERSSSKDKKKMKK
jgi:hypothetical protein